MATFDDLLQSTLAEEQSTKFSVRAHVLAHKDEIARVLAQDKPPRFAVLATVLTKLAQETTPTAPKITLRTLRRHLRALGIKRRRSKKTASAKQSTATARKPAPALIVKPAAATLPPLPPGDASATPTSAVITRPMRTSGASLSAAPRLPQRHL